MIPHGGKILFTCLVFGAGGTHSVQGQLEAQADSAAMLVASQVRSQLVFLWDVDIPNSAIHATALLQDTGDLAVWRVVVPMPHGGPSYLVGHSSEGMIRLGGFPAPDLFAAARAIKRSEQDPSEDLLGHARKLAILGDTQDAEVAEDVVFPFGPDSLAPAAVQWRKIGAWQVADTIVMRENHEHVAIVTILTHRVHVSSFVAPWLGSVYSFVFDPSGNLMAWTKYLSKPFGLAVDTD